MALKVVVDSPNLCFHTSSCILQEKSLAELAWTEKLASSLLTNGFQKDLHPGAEIWLRKDFSRHIQIVI